MADSAIPLLKRNAPGTHALPLSEARTTALTTPQQGLATGILVGEILSGIQLITALVAGALGGGLKLALLHGAMALGSGAVILLTCTGAGALTGQALHWLNSRQN